MDSAPPPKVGGSGGGRAGILGGSPGVPPPMVGRRAREVGQHNPSGRKVTGRFVGPIEVQQRMRIGRAWPQRICWLPCAAAPRRGGLPRGESGRAEAILAQRHLSGGQQTTSWDGGLNCGRQPWRHSPCGPAAPSRPRSHPPARPRPPAPPRRGAAGGGPAPPAPAAPVPQRTSGLRRARWRPLGACDYHHHRFPGRQIGLCRPTCPAKASTVTRALPPMPTGAPLAGAAAARARARGRARPRTDAGVDGQVRERPLLAATCGPAGVHSEHMRLRMGSR